MGKLMGSVTLEGWLARVFYASLYRMHQVPRVNAWIRQVPVRVRESAFVV